MTSPSPLPTSRRRSAAPLLAGLLVAVVAVASACGSSGSSNPAAAAPTTSSGVASVSTTSGSGAPSSTASRSPSTGHGSVSAFVAAPCTLVTRAQAATVDTNALEPGETETHGADASCTYAARSATGGFNGGVVVGIIGLPFVASPSQVSPSAFSQATVAGHAGRCMVADHAFQAAIDSGHTLSIVAPTCAEAEAIAAIAYRSL